MDLTKLADDRAVSPVIGVILMVAITVILAAVIGAFALSFTQGGQSSAPQVSFTAEYNETADNVVQLTVSSGDTVDAEAVTFEGDVTSAGSADVDTEGQDWTAGDLNDGESFSAGDSITIGVTGPDYEVDLVWTDGSESSILTTLEGPGA
jgi:flagellin-like protein